MNTIKLSLIALISISTLVQAGGDFSPITPYETEDVQLAEETYIEPVVEEVVVVPAPVAVVEEMSEEAPSIEDKEVYANGFYAGLGIAASRYQTNCDSTCAKGGIDKTLGIVARVGYDFNKYIGLEARGIRTNIKDDGGAVKHAGIFVKPMIPVGDKINIYGLVGFAKTTTQGSLQRTSAEALALGAGVEVDLSADSPKDGRYNREFDGKGNQEKGLGLFIDYERMVVKSGAPDLDALSAGITYDF